MIYLMDEPFECFRHGRRGHVVAYRGNGTFLFVRANGSTTWSAADWLTPPPPIPAAARKPKMGEVWMCDGVPLLLVRWAPERGNWLTSGKDVETGPVYLHPNRLARPATPEEAEPFRPLLEGLKASLGEE